MYEFVVKFFYFYPNKKIISNYCYLIIFDLLLQGRILSSKDTFWLCHAYSAKSYNRGDGSNFRGKLKILIRRVNVYILYCFKAYRKKKIYLPFVFLSSLIGISRDVSQSIRNTIINCLINQR